MKIKSEKIAVEAHTIISAIRSEAQECANSAEDMRNTPQDRGIFYVVSIVLGGIADKLSRSPSAAKDALKLHKL